MEEKDGEVEETSVETDGFGSGVESKSSPTVVLNDPTTSSSAISDAIQFSLLDFPVELLLRQLSFLSEKDLFSVSMTCRYLHQLSRSNSLWM